MPWVRSCAACFAAVVLLACETSVNLGDDCAPCAAGSGGTGQGGSSGSGGGGGGFDAEVPDVRSDGLVDAPHDATDATDASHETTDSSTGPKRIFVTRGEYEADFGGLDQGDFLCQSSADGAGLGGTWKAWLSDSNTAAPDRIFSNGPWIEIGSGTTLFNNAAGLRGFPLAEPTNDELGDPSPDRWWTGTDINGVISDKHCVDWTSNDQFQGGTTGMRRGVGGVPGMEWTQDTAYSCAQEGGFSLLCLED